jgi:hypothetical protein
MIVQLTVPPPITFFLHVRINDATSCADLNRKPRSAPIVCHPLFNIVPPELVFAVALAWCGESAVIPVLLTGGLQLCVLAVTAEYLAAIYDMTR